MAINEVEDDFKVVEDISKEDKDIIEEANVDLYVEVRNKVFVDLTEEGLVPYDHVDDEVGAIESPRDEPLCKVDDGAHVEVMHLEMVHGSKGAM